MNNLYLDYAIIIILGLAIGSLLNVVVLRFDDLKSIINGRSHCPQCKAKLAWYDLIPFLSYLVLFGKCRYCKKNISLQYPLVEVGTAILFALFFYKFGWSLAFFFNVLIASLLIVVFVYDILHYLIADILVWIAIGLWAIWLVLEFFVGGKDTTFLLNSVYGGLALGGFLGLIVLVSWEKWMGAGDIKLGFVLGAIMGWPIVLVGGFLAFTLGSLISLILIAAKVKTMKDMIPFAPFLISGTYLAVIFGSSIIDWYLNGLGI